MMTNGLRSHIPVVELWSQRGFGNYFGLHVRCPFSSASLGDLGELQVQSCW